LIDNRTKNPVSQQPLVILVIQEGAIVVCHCEICKTVILDHACIGVVAAKLKCDERPQKGDKSGDHDGRQT